MLHDATQPRDRPERSDPHRGALNRVADPIASLQLQSFAYGLRYCGLSSGSDGGFEHVISPLPWFLTYALLWAIGKDVSGAERQLCGDPLSTRGGRRRQPASVPRSSGTWRSEAFRLSGWVGVSRSAALSLRRLSVPACSLTCPESPLIAPYVNGLSCYTVPPWNSQSPLVLAHFVFPM